MSLTITIHVLFMCKDRVQRGRVCLFCILFLIIYIFLRIPDDSHGRLLNSGCTISKGLVKPYHICSHGLSHCHLNSDRIDQQL